MTHAILLVAWLGHFAWVAVDVAVRDFSRGAGRATLGPMETAAIQRRTLLLLFVTQIISDLMYTIVDPRIDFEARA